MSGNGSEDNKVGYKQPPIGTRFKKGQSGNPGGRPKGIQSKAAFAHDVLSQKVQILVNGKLQWFVIEELASRSLARKAAEGDLSVITKLINWREPLAPVHDVDEVITFSLVLEEDDPPQHPTGYPDDPPPDE